MILTWILSLLQHLPLLQHDPHDVQLAFNWGPIIAAGINVVGGLLSKKGKDKQADAAGAALGASEAARKQALGQLSDANINAILSQFFPGLLGGSGAGAGTGPMGSAMGARGAGPTLTAPWANAMREGFTGAGGSRPSGGGPGAMADSSPNVDRGAWADGGTYPQFVESHPGAGQEADQRARAAVDWILKNAVGVEGLPQLGKQYAMPGGAGVENAGTGGNPGPKQHAYKGGVDVTGGGKPKNFWGESGEVGSGAQRAATQAWFESVPHLQGGSCFPAGTLVLTPHGPVPIETLQEGDMVVGGEGSVPVIKQRELSASRFLVLNGTLLVTDEHPFAVRPWNGPLKWVRAAELKVHDELVGLEMPGAVTSIGVQVEATRAVYNPEVGAPHTYFVLLGETPVLVHNKTANTQTGGNTSPLRFAQGGNPPPGVPVMVGEQGPEQVILPQGGTVVPNPSTPQPTTQTVPGGQPPGSWTEKLVTAANNPPQPPGSVSPTLPGNRTPGAPPPGPGGIDRTPQVGTTPAPAAPANAGQLASQAITGFLQNPGQTSTIGYERDVENANQALNARRMGISGELTGAGIDPSSGAGQFALSEAIGDTHRARNDASRKQSEREETLRREDLDRGIKDYMAALQMSFNLAAAKASAIAGTAFPQVTPINTYEGLASGVSSLGYFLGQALNNSGSSGTTSVSTSRPRGTGGDAAMNGD